MTHGCIAVRRFDEKRKREILLHTYHSGYLIPDIVKAVPAFICAHRWKFIIERQIDYPTYKDLKEGIMRLGFDDGMFYQPTVAALLIAQSPWMLEVCHPDFKADMASWSGSDHPYVLEMREAASNWKLYDEEGEVILSFDPVKEMLDWLWGQIQGVKSK